MTTTSSLKIAFVGGGTVTWTPNIVRDILLTSTLQNAEIVLLDIDIRAAQLCKTLSEKLASELNLDVKLTATDAIADIAGAQYVIIAISTGGLDAMAHDLANEAEPEFLLDAARWCYDEIRHCRMGCARLAEWGFEPCDIPIGSFSYDAGADCDALTRLGIIFYFESTYIGTKNRRMKIFGEFGDRVSSHDMDFDWADEQIHTHYGTRWLKYFLEKRGDTRKPTEFRAESEAAIAHLHQNATPRDKEQTRAAFEHMMGKARCIAAS